MNRRDIIGNTKIKNIPGKIRKKIGPSVSKGIKTVKNFVSGAKSGVKNMTVADVIMNTVAPGSTIIREGVKEIYRKPDKVKRHRAPGKPPTKAPFKLRSGNKPSIAKLAGLKRDPKDPFYVIPKGPEVKDNMPNQKPNPKFIQEGVNKGAFENLLPKGKNNNKKLPSDIFINLLPKQKPTGKINITKDIKKRK